MKELKLKTDVELNQLLADLKVAVATNRFGRIFKSVKDTSAVSKAKKTIARINTLKANKAK